MKSNTKKLIRWIFFLPVSLVLGFLATFPLHWILYYTISSTGILSSVEHFLSPIVLMAIATFSAFWIAPKYKFQASLGVGIFWLIFILFGFIIMPKAVSFEIRTLFTLITISVCLFVNYKRIKK